MGETLTIPVIVYDRPQTGEKPGKRSLSICRVTNKDGLCRYCGADLWWGVSPTGSKVPIDPPAADVEARSHWLTCPGAREAAVDRDRKKADVHERDARQRAKP